MRSTKDYNMRDVSESMRHVGLRGDMRTIDIGGAFPSSESSGGGGGNRPKEDVDYLTFTPSNSSGARILVHVFDGNLNYSIDNSKFIPMEVGYTSIIVPFGSKVCFLGDETVGKVTFRCPSGYVSASGSVHTLFGEQIGETAPNCSDMFTDMGAALLSAPTLPWEKLSEGCYAGMFRGCSNIMVSPILPAKILTTNCYRKMFENCTSLERVTCLATDMTAQECTFIWVSNTPSLNTFEKAEDAVWEEGINGIPSACTIADYKRYYPYAIQDYDGNVYDAVVLGDQVWMAENLRATRYADGTELALGSTVELRTAYRYYPDNNSDLVAKYGYLYNWAGSMKGASSSDSNPSHVQGIAPDGWHIPSVSEWRQLVNYVSANYSPYNAKSLASKTDWTSSTIENDVGYDLDTNNTTLFNALPAGYFGSGYQGLGTSARFWTATDAGDRYAVSYNINYNGKTVTSNSSYGKAFGYSVRCVYDGTVKEFIKNYEPTKINKE